MSESPDGHTRPPRLYHPSQNHPSDHNYHYQQPVSRSHSRYPPAAGNENYNPAPLPLRSAAELEMENGFLKEKIASLQHDVYNKQNQIDQLNSTLNTLMLQNTKLLENIDATRQQPMPSSSAPPPPSSSHTSLSDIPLPPPFDADSTKWPFWHQTAFNQLSNSSTAIFTKEDKPRQYVHTRYLFAQKNPNQLPSEQDIKVMKDTAGDVLAGMAAQGLLPKQDHTYTDLDGVQKDVFRARMELRHPELRNCAGHWQADHIGTRACSSWKTSARGKVYLNRIKSETPEVELEAEVKPKARLVSGSLSVVSRTSSSTLHSAAAPSRFKLKAEIAAGDAPPAKRPNSGKAERAEKKSVEDGDAGMEGVAVMLPVSENENEIAVEQAEKPKKKKRVKIQDPAQSTIAESAPAKAKSTAPTPVPDKIDPKPSKPPPRARALVPANKQRIASSSAKQLTPLSSPARNVHDALSDAPSPPAAPAPKPAAVVIAAPTPLPNVSASLPTTTTARRTSRTAKPVSHPDAARDEDIDVATEEPAGRKPSNRSGMSTSSRKATTETRGASSNKGKVKAKSKVYKVKQQDGEGMCGAEWLETNPNGTEEEFAAYWNRLDFDEQTKYHKAAYTLKQQQSLID
ncbi:hypothetical protein MKEN_00578000 [Mycena kentingensis (nom. inval.)]|nr:hypothetical protein MKEN_00578000 [Mycena kentingensis (nom. inval.)]